MKYRLRFGDNVVSDFYENGNHDWSYYTFDKKDMELSLQQSIGLVRKHKIPRKNPRYLYKIEIIE